MAVAAQKLTLRERNKIRLRRELLEAVLDLFNDGDFSALNVENIARHVGCSKATIYVYFPGGRDEMLQTLYEEIAGEVTAEGDRRRLAATTTLGRIVGLAESLLEMSTRPRRGKFFAQLNPILSPVLLPVLGHSSGRYVELISQDLAEVSNEDVNAYAILLVGGFREASVKIAENPELKPALLDGVSKLAESLIKTLIAERKKDR